ncbi:sigma-54-dependent Fis family transcriptional regulator [Ammoniphilus sp. CFH 90114]|uniref:sigma-54 interaction domain-containing protein n=1 Tax=Ammoniphilus sp. CFH 90114 TaxID=2493665 RepID=UPI00100F414C|nr:sigma 54-interacting transcriptional regulator [Ammoniphilus sp. CFH 90114]RXT05851.1 PAS domain S-box protein [Ammoniphilus sp. CFH 90114]
MFKVEHLSANTSFINIEPSAPLNTLHNLFLEAQYAIVQNELSYIISANEWESIAQHGFHELTIQDWLLQQQWLPSTSCLIEEIYSTEINWKRPIIVIDHQENVKGVVSAECFITFLLKENRQLEAYFTALSETVNDAVTAVDRDGEVICWNSSAELTYGIRKEDILHRKIGEHFQQESIMLLRILDVGRPVRQIYHQPTPDTHVLINASPILENNQVIGGIATEQDITRIVQLNEELYSSHPVKMEKEEDPFSLFIARGHAMKQAIQLAKKVSKTRTPVLLIGEPGTGKERLAWAIHFAGHRKNEPIIAVHCQAVPPALLEAELFGYQGGAFTGNETLGKPGKLELAANGSLFIEDIHTMELETQGKLLEFLQQQSFVRTGGTEPIQVNVRIMASSDQDLMTLVEQGQFLRELYYQISVLPIEIPSLRHRVEDLPELVHRLLRDLTQQHEKPMLKLDPVVMSVLMSYHWPGNIKELRNVMERCVILAEEDMITVEHLPKNLTPSIDMGNKIEEDPPGDIMLKARVSHQEEVAIIEEALRKTYGNKSAAAKLLGISRGTLYNKMKEYDLI